MPDSDTADAPPISPSAVPNADVDFFQTLVENTSDGLLTIDRDSQIVFANPAIEDILGYPPEELVGSSKLEIIPERLRPVHERQLEAYIETGDRNIDWDGMELPALHKDGHEVPVSISLREHDYRGTTLFTGVFRDISERKEREERLQEQNERLTEFASVLSHDLQSLVNVAQGYTMELSEGSDHDQDELEEIQDALTRIQELHDDMLTLTHYDEPRSVETVSLETIAAESWRWVNTKNAQLVVTDDVQPIQADGAQFKSLLENLFNNAVEHGGPDTTVEIGWLESGAGFYVADDGAGIPEEEQDAIFEHGYTTHLDGTGLGLSIVEQVAAAHDWDLTLGDCRDGARFEFRLE
ncbi:sensor box histidine kinase [Natrialba magadii ATCC 43099]|uniref:histidine kinase n=1 Tax=Natrialba magadii (strain ATCC 43099 / DSM 3394 / CCM 3739 / CIP 104546 / IAM 13178 / JCM 8861 / NBRC 102185 / NCIMB 2190 / MS3) TaxID=547559 RepID=D3SWG8_NATMM|nr:PAS domain-containing sensor histidine kinase [Natrialba magadii]ADD03760.1 sensor box histidine kinase [Natrialba magadii ATCC 43099]ELY33815.1 PAS/PAC sensor signal transduction histidine kinase [Natrialba magadii ATCC 43099]